MISPVLISAARRRLSGEEPATTKQMNYLAVLEKQKGVKVLTEAERQKGLTKSEASERIESLKNQ